MDNKDSKRLVKTRQHYKELNDCEVKQWKRLKQLKDNRMVRELQKKEMETINEELIRLRDEYRRICDERGRAHKWAQIVSKHEMQRKDFEMRRNKEVMDRSVHTLNAFIDDNNTKQLEKKIEKQNQLLKRKELMKSTVYKQNVAKEDVHILRQLDVLKKSEDLLRETIEHKKQMSHSEEFIERNAERLFWPKKLVPKQDLLYSSSVSSIDLNEKCAQHSHQNTHENRDQNSHQYSDQNEDQNRDQKDSLNKIEEMMKGLKNSVDAEEDFPTSVVIKLYERLKKHRKTGEQKNVKVYKNVAISTDNHLKAPVINSDLIDSETDQSLSDSSRQTTYMSVPNAPKVTTNRAAIALSDLYKKHLLNKCLNDMTSNSSNSTIDEELQDLTIDRNLSQTLDPLINRINNLKELIEQKVANNSEFQSKHIDSNDVKDVNRVNGVNEREQIVEDNQNGENSLFGNCVDNIDSMSSSSSSSFKTLQAMSGLDDLLPLPHISSQLYCHQNQSLSLNDLNGQPLELASINAMDSTMNSSLKSYPLRDRKAFWKDVLERAGIDMDSNTIEDCFSFAVSESEPTVDSMTSFSLKSLSFEHNSHSTPKR